jgi:hypothetical protein
MAMQVHYGNDQHITLFNRVNDTIGKPVRATAADFRVKQMPGLGPANNAVDGLANFPKKIMAQPRNTVFIILCRIL